MNNFDDADCIICKKKFQRRKKGMKKRAYKGNVRPYRSITCSKKCALQNRDANPKQEVKEE